MMRYYLLEIEDKEGNTPKASDGTPIGPFNSDHSPGCALRIDFDVTITSYDVTNSGAVVSIYGLPVTMLNQSTKLNGCLLNLEAGFSGGLPLENEKQKGLIISGEIYNPYANWIGTHQSMHFIVNPSPLVNAKGEAAGITLDGKIGEKMSDVLRRALSNAYRGFDIEIDIDDKIVQTENMPAFYPRLEPLAKTVRSQSFHIMNSDDYIGVQMVIQNRTIRVFDNGTSKGDVKKILPQELIGQPTWVGPFTVSFKCPLRSDLTCGDVVELPQNIYSGPGSLLSVNSESSYSIYRDALTFSGKFKITSVRHVGSYLDPDGDNAWVSIFEAVA